MQTVDRWRLVPIPADITTRVEVPDISDQADILELGAAYKAARVRLHQANGRLAEINRIQGTERQD